jgi:hypothetical protein
LVYDVHAGSRFGAGIFAQIAKHLLELAGRMQEIPNEVSITMADEPRFATHVSDNFRERHLIRRTVAQSMEVGVSGDFSCWIEVLPSAKIHAICGSNLYQIHHGGFDEST